MGSGCLWLALAHRSGNMLHVPSVWNIGLDQIFRKKFAWADQEESKPVGLLKPNRWGLSGMSGNIGEICWDAYDETTYTKRVQAGTITKNPAVRDTNRALARGGCWGELIALQTQYFAGGYWEQYFYEE